MTDFPLPQIQGVNPSMTVTRESEDGDISDRTDDSATAIELPLCELSKLDNIHSLVMSSVSPTERLMLGLAIERESYIPKLLDLFHVCEDLENMEGLRQLFDVFRTLIFHNNASMFQVCGVGSSVTYSWIIWWGLKFGSFDGLPLHCQIKICQYINLVAVYCTCCNPLPNHQSGSSFT